MRNGLKGNMLPESLGDFEALLDTAHAMNTNCLECKAGFSERNTHSALGWAETQISGICEDCFDKLFEDEGE